MPLNSPDPLPYGRSEFTSQLVGWSYERRWSEGVEWSMSPLLLKNLSNLSLSPGKNERSGGERLNMLKMRSEKRSVTQTIDFYRFLLQNLAIYTFPQLISSWASSLLACTNELILLLFKLWYYFSFSHSYFIWILALFFFISCLWFISLSNHILIF